MKIGRGAGVAGIAVAFVCTGLAGGCGRSGVLDETRADSGGPGSGGSSGGPGASSSSSGSGPIEDASMPDAGCDVSRLEAEVCQQFLSPGSDPQPSAFGSRAYLLYFFRQSALTSDPALCGVGTTTLDSCAYDPTVPRSGPGDVHHSNALGEFVGPEGDPWIWDYVAPRNAWIAVDEKRSPTNYALVLEYETCFLEEGAGPGATVDASADRGPSSLCPQGTASCGATESCLATLVASAPACGGLPDWVFVFTRPDAFNDYMRMVLETDAASVDSTEAQFVGANGHPYVWGYFRARNRWFVVDGYYEPAAYQLVVEYDQCTAPDAAAD